MRRRSKAVALVVAGLLVTGCAEVAGPGADPVPGGASATMTSGPERDGLTPEDGEIGSDEVPPPATIEDEAPPPVTIGWDGRSQDLFAWTYCYGATCADGIPPEDPHDVGSPDQVVVDFPLVDWDFAASFEEVGEECPRLHDVELEDRGGGTHVLTPAGSAGTYDVTLFGKGDGDLFVTFRWTTPIDGALNGPEARVGVLADHDGRLDSYGVELELRDLATTPTEANARIDIVDGDGNELTTIVLDDDDRTEDHGDGDCVVESNLAWYLDVEASGRTSAEWQKVSSDDGPFTYDVDVELDGTLHRATATWPD